VEDRPRQRGRSAALEAGDPRSHAGYIIGSWGPSSVFDFPPMWILFGLGLAVVLRAERQNEGLSGGARADGLRSEARREGARRLAPLPRPGDERSLFVEDQVKPLALGVSMHACCRRPATRRACCGPSEAAPQASAPARTAVQRRCRVPRVPVLPRMLRVARRRHDVSPCGVCRTSAMLQSTSSTPIRRCPMVRRGISPRL
jgi:hypothetical protein